MRKLLKTFSRYHSALQTKCQAGQVLVIGLFVCVGLMLAAVTVANVGMMVAEKIQLQDTVDASAYSAAVVQARYMNLSAYINRAMMANYNSMAFNTGVWAVADSTDHGLAVVTALLYEVAFVVNLIPAFQGIALNIDNFADVVKEGHGILHTFNHYLNEIFAQDDDAQDLNQYIEIYTTDILSTYQGLLLGAMQAARNEIIKDVAAKMDPEVITTTSYGLAAETVSFDEMKRAVDYIIRDPGSRGLLSFPNEQFNGLAGTAPNEDDHPLYLAATTEASLDRFSAGRNRDGEKDRLRNMGSLENIIPGTGALETLIDILCEASSFGFDDCDAEISLTLGAEMRDGYEDKAEDTHVPFIARQRMREVNFFGIRFTLNTEGEVPTSIPGVGSLAGATGQQGHTSAEKNADVGNVENSTLELGSEINVERALESIQYNGSCALGIVGPPTCGLNYLNILQATLNSAVLTPPLIADGHWDGTFDDIEPVDTYSPYIPNPVDAVEYAVEIASEGREIGVPKYDWRTDVDNVGFPYYYYPTDGATRRPNGSKGGGGDLNLLTGPSIAVVGVRPQEKINGLQGLKIGNPYSMTAIARSQVYYVRNPNRPEELPSLFNPHWVGRLAPIDSDDSPPLLRDGLPFVTSMGLGIAPTH